MGSIRKQSIGGALANDINSPGVTMSLFSQTVINLSYICPIDKKMKKLENEDDLNKYAINLGCLCGIVYSIKIIISPFILGDVSTNIINLAAIDNFKIEENNINEFLYFFAEPNKIGQTSIKLKTNDYNKKIIPMTRPSETRPIYNDILTHSYDELIFPLALKLRGLKYMNQTRLDIGNDKYIPRIWYRSGRKFYSSYTYIEFFVPKHCVSRILTILSSIRLDEIAPNVQLRLFNSNDNILSGSYGVDTASILFPATIKELYEIRHIIDLLNTLGVRWYFGENMDEFFYKGYIERVYSNEVRDIICNRYDEVKSTANLRPYLTRALEHVQIYEKTWSGRFEENLNIIEQNCLMINCKLSSHNYSSLEIIKKTHIAFVAGILSNITTVDYQSSEKV